jgi:hypothetical protein
MSNTKFTQGEWELLGYTIMSKDNKFDLAKVTVFNEGKANAHLMSQSKNMYKMIEILSAELFIAINEVNEQRASRITNQTENEPDYMDMQTIHEAQLLLKKARGE